MTRSEFIEFERLARKARRVCLCCDEEFDSRSRGNRVCRKCQQSEEFQHGILPRGRELRGHPGDTGDDS